MSRDFNILASYYGEYHVCHLPIFCLESSCRKLSDLIGHLDGPYSHRTVWQRDSTYRVPLLDSKLVRPRYAWYYCRPSSALAALGTPQPSFWTLHAVEPHLTYPNLYIVSCLHICYLNIGEFRGVWGVRTPQEYNHMHQIKFKVLL